MSCLLFEITIFCHYNKADVLFITQLVLNKKKLQNYFAILACQKRKKKFGDDERIMNMLC